jgi:hypothetical protein
VLPLPSFSNALLLKRVVPIEDWRYQQQKHDSISLYKRGIISVRKRTKPSSTYKKKRKTKSSHSFTLSLTSKSKTLKNEKGRIVLLSFLLNLTLGRVSILQEQHQCLLLSTTFEWGFCTVRSLLSAYNMHVIFYCCLITIESQFLNIYTYVQSVSE